MTAAREPAGNGATAIRTDEPVDALRVRPATRLRGEPALPGDKSISHRALLLALLAEGTSRIEGAGDGEDVRTTAAFVRSLGATVERTPTDGGRVRYRVDSPGAAGIGEPEHVLDGGNSGTTVRLATGILAGVFAGTEGLAVLDGDASLRRRPMGRIVHPLRLMGAGVDGRGGGNLLPIVVRGRAPLTAIDYPSPLASAQVKSAILLAALAAEGRTTVLEPLATRDHTERMLRARGVPVTERIHDDGRHEASMNGPAIVGAVNDRVPADPSGAAFWLVAASVHPDAELTLREVSTNPTRRAIIDLLRRMGADIEERELPGSGGDGGEPLADLVVRSARLRGIECSPADVAAAIDEIPVLCLAAALAAGTTRIRGAGELRNKESDRIAGIAAGLTALGAQIIVEGDDIEIRGGRPLRGAVTETHDDHRLAMTFAIAGLMAEGETIVRRPASAAISYPGFFGELEGVRA